jgi:nucleotide-binding universal stress UspA family protein
LTLLEVTGIRANEPLPSGRLLSGKRHATAPEVVDLTRWLGATIESCPPETTEVAVAFGIPGIEIGRIAEERKIDLVVLGRRPRSADQPLLLGEIADAVVRRSPRPVLLVPPAVTQFRRVLVAFDGTERTFVVLRPALALAAMLGATVTVVTVKHGGGAGDLGRYSEALHRMAGPGPAPTTKVRAGNPITEVLAEVDETGADVLVIGYRRGGPPKVFGPADIARTLLYSAPSAVMTVPV